MSGFPNGARVKINGLIGAPAWNGKGAKVFCKDNNTGRYTVEIDGVGQRNLKPENLAPDFSKGTILVGNSRCPFAQRVWLALEEAGLDYIRYECELDPKPPWLFDINPRGMVPVLIVDGETLVASDVIVDTIVARARDKIPGSDEPREKTWRTIMDTEFRPAYFSHDLSQVQAALKKLDPLLTGPFLTGASLSATDILAGPMLQRVFEDAAWTWTGDISKMQAWWTAISEREAFRKTTLPPGSYWTAPPPAPQTASLAPQTAPQTAPVLKRRVDLEASTGGDNYVRQRENLTPEPNFPQLGKNPVALTVKLPPARMYQDPRVSGLQELYRSGQFTDVVLVCAEHRFPAHRVVLACQSSVFKERLQASEATRQIVEILVEIPNPDAVKFMLDYLYSSDDKDWATYNPRTQAIHHDVLSLARQFQLPGLTQRATSLLTKDLTTGNVLERLSTCDEFGLNELFENILEQLTHNPRALAEVAHSSQIKEYPNLSLAMLQKVAMLQYAAGAPEPEQESKPKSKKVRK